VEGESMIRVISLLCVTALFGSCSASAQDQDKRFVEVSGDNDTVTFDLSTVRMIQTGRFAVVSTTIDLPDVMKLKLKVLDTLRVYCTRPDGNYPAPADIFTLGPPDMPVKSIEVKSIQSNRSGKTYRSKTVLWFYPYKRLAWDTAGGPEEFFAGLYAVGGRLTRRIITLSCTRPSRTATAQNICLIADGA
jgi:hypothetical protein